MFDSSQYPYNCFNYDADDYPAGSSDEDKRLTRPAYRPDSAGEGAPGRDPHVSPAPHGKEHPRDLKFSIDYILSSPDPFPGLKPPCLAQEGRYTRLENVGLHFWTM
ncbi:PREDICTED: forkhead box L1-like [Mandrillus leucophaeus]|uniref:forkhead box L1-like n=1 Tax=Mandrillus leucophaeus TaxID=9568 RepID=UPI0005F49EE0|nr:PREDICTED: forkhead box L1-like [Mandrillus leucophaeus]